MLCLQTAGGAYNTGIQPSLVGQARIFSKEVIFKFLKDEKGEIKWGRGKVGRKHSWPGPSKHTEPALRRNLKRHQQSS